MSKQRKDGSIPVSIPEMKPGWEQTLMAEDIFKRAVARHLSIVRWEKGVGLNKEALEGFAEGAVAAAIQWQKTQKKHKLLHIITTGNIGEEE